MSSWDSNGDPPEFHEAARPPVSPKRTEGSAPVTGGSPAGADGEPPKPLIEWNSSHDQMLIDAFAREGETAPSWLTNPIFAPEVALTPAPPAEARDRLLGPADPQAEHDGPAPADLFSEPDRPLVTDDPITAPNEAFFLADPSPSTDEPPSWLYASGVPSPPDHLTDRHRRSIAWRRHLPVVAAVGLVVTVGVGSAVLLGHHSGPRRSNRQPVAIAGQTTTTSPGSVVPGTDGAATATTGDSPTATPTDPAAIATSSPGSVGAQSAVSSSGHTTGGVVAGPQPATRPPPLTQAPPPLTQPPTTPSPPPTTVTTLPPTTVTTRPPRTITTPPPITRPTLPQTSTTIRPHH